MNHKAKAMLAFMTAVGTQADPHGLGAGRGWGGPKKAKPKFTDSELEWVRSQPTKRDRKLAVETLRKKYGGSK